MSSSSSTLLTSGITDDMIADYIKKFYLWILCVVGIPTDILVIFIARSMQAWTPATFLVAAVAFIDTCALVSSTVFWVLHLNRVHNTMVCKTEFIPDFLSIMSNWTLMYLCVERAIDACCVGKKSTSSACLSRWVFILSLTAMTFFIYLLLVFLNLFYYSPHSHECVLDKENVSFFYYFGWTKEALTLIIPYAVLITLAIVLALAGCLGQRRRPGLSSSDEPRGETLGKDERIERALSLMAFWAAVFVVLFTFPSFIFSVNRFNGNSLGKLFQQVKEVLITSTLALKFFVYLLAADGFRKACCGGAKPDTTFQEMKTTE